MDPRLNPNISRPSFRIMQDVRPTRSHSPLAIEGPNPPAPEKPLTNPPVRPDDRSQFISEPKITQPTASKRLPQSPITTTEIVESIPMRQPESIPTQKASLLNTIQMPGSENNTAQPQDDLDKILQAVNSRVKSPIGVVQKKPKQEVLSKIIRKVAKANIESQRPKPVLAMSVVIIIALTLSVVAVMAYRQGSKASTLSAQPGKVGTSYASGAAIQAAGGTLVRPSDLDDFSQTLQESLNSLNDKQDFDTTGLSAQLIGL